MNGLQRTSESFVTCIFHMLARWRSRRSNTFWPQIPIWTVFAFSFIYCLLPAHAHAQEVDGMQFCVDNECTQKKIVAWSEVAKNINDNLTNAQQVNIYAGNCYSYTLLNKASSILKAPYFVGTAVNTTEPTPGDSGDATTGWSTDDVDPPGRYKAPNGLFYYSYKMYLSKSAVNRTANGNPVPSAQTLHSDAAGWVAQDPKMMDDNHPASATGNGGNGGLALNGGATATWSLLFTGNYAGLSLVAEQQYWKAIKLLKPNNFQYYYYDGTLDGAVVAGSGTYTNWKAALTKMMKEAGANKNKILFNIFLGGHGIREEANTSLAPGGIPGQPGQGVVIGQASGQTTVLTVQTDAEFWREMGVGITDLSGDDIQGTPPTFSIAASAASVTTPITVSIGSIELGTFTLPSTTGGGEADIPLSTDIVQNIISTYGGASSLDLTFTIASGDWIRVGLEPDLLQAQNYAPLMYGTGILTSVSKQLEPPAPVPMPAWSIAIFGALLLGISALYIQRCAIPRFTLIC